jgi:hypothetical protein
LAIKLAVDPARTLPLWWAALWDIKPGAVSPLLPQLNAEYSVPFFQSQCNVAKQ